MYRVLEIIPALHEIFIMGDFNSWIEREEKGKVVEQFGEDKFNDNGEQIKELCRLRNLMIIAHFWTLWYSQMYLHTRK